MALDANVSERLTARDEPMGTPQYISPEMLTGSPWSPASDLYSLGMTLYRMAAGRLPFESQTVSGWISSHIVETPLPIREAAPEGDFPDALGDLFDRLFVKNPKERIQTAAEVLEALDAITIDLGSGRKSRMFGKFRRGF